DYVLVNDDIEATEALLKTIVGAERMRRAQQPGLQAHVRGLQMEFERGGT
ncbi:MAG: guanylate kinase, partial [Pseudomonadota bacterium]